MYQLNSLFSCGLSQISSVKSVRTKFHWLSLFSFSDRPHYHISQAFRSSIPPPYSSNRVQPNRLEEMRYNPDPDFGNARDGSAGTAEVVEEGTLH